MKVEHINPIFNATQSIIKDMLQMEIKKGEMEVKKKNFSGEKINASIGVTGDLEGFVYFSMNEETALAIVEKMSGMEIEDFGDLASSAIGELANIITGNSITNLNEQGFECNITPPSITVGDNLQISSGPGEFLSIPLHTEIGDFIINVSLKKS
jgi:chemotaxis protein CheX